MNLIIQGPITSKTSFRNLSRNKKNKKDTVTFICLENIEKILKEYRNKFNYIIISTWLKDKIFKKDLDLICNKYKVDIIYLKIPYIKYPIQWQIKDNRHLQYYGTLEAIYKINKLKKNRDKVTLKIRTDQYIYLDPIINQIKNHKDQLKEKILFPYALSGDLFSVSDFFVAGHHSLMKKYYEFLFFNLKIPSGSKSAHVDQVQKYLDVIQNTIDPYRSFSRIFTIVGGDCMKQKLFPIEEKHIRIWYKLLNKNFILSKNNWVNNSYWRGSNMDFAKEKIYYEDLKSYETFYKKMTKRWNRKISSDNFMSTFIFSKLPIYRKKYKLFNPLFFISYYLRVFLLKL